MHLGLSTYELYRFFSMCLFLQMLSKLLKYSATWKNIMHRFKFVVKNVRRFKSCGVLSPAGSTTIKLQKSRSSHHLIQENLNLVHFQRPNFRLRDVQTSLVNILTFHVPLFHCSIVPLFHVATYEKAEAI